MTESLHHRGPDQQGVFYDSQIALGAVRLQVMDLDGGEQPIHTDDGAFTIVYNGEIYNFAELRRELEALGHQFRSSCDTEVALRAFVEWDTDCFQRFRGMFALAIWSSRQQRLILGRDRLGIKPLYIRQTGGKLIFGSELKALLAHPAATRQLDPIALEQFLTLNYVPSPRTLIAGIEKLPAGSFLEWRGGESTITRYWKLEMRPDSRITEAAATEELDSLLRSAVKEQLVSDVPLGVWASGGVDSSTLVHYAAELGARPLKTFSIAFESKSCDESRWFREIARLYGTEHYEFELNRSSDVSSAIEDFAFYADEPGADAGALPVWFLSKMTREHVTVALSGEGGDELFGGYMTYRADALARHLRRVPRAFRRLGLSLANQLLPVSDAKIGFEYKVKRFLEGSLLNDDQAHFFWNGSFSAAQRREILGRGGKGLAGLYANLAPASEIGWLNRFMLADQHYYLQDNLLAKVDRMSMAHSLEVRPPLLDHRIVEFAARLPEKLKMDGANQKIILKKTMQGKLPDAILNRKKSGLDIPAHEWFRGPLLPLLRDTITPEALRKWPLFAPEAVENLIRDHESRRRNVGYQLWGLLTLFLWMKKWNIEVPEPSRQEEVSAYASAGL
ncbi:MAG: asparagine synthase (glutamine-hydrolyzing) [Bryobacterales bacterium]|nr:asparagine synthase (glutamine-hydrolyzing) [Bryobacterales bacterium]